MSGLGAQHKSQHGGEILTIQCGSVANWIGAQYHLLQNSNCDVHAPFQRSTHFRRNGASGSSAAQGEWTPRVVALDASVGLDGVVATYGAQEASASATQERAMREYQMEKQRQAGGGGGGAAAAAAPAKSSRPKHWSDLSKNVYSYHAKSLFPLPGLYEGTSDFHSYDQGSELLAKESISEEVFDRIRWFLEECDQPDGIHLLVEANSGWSGVGGRMLQGLRDEYEKIPIFCVSGLVPPPPRSLLGSTFASATTLVQSVLNSSLLLNTAAQLSTAYLPLTTHYWATSSAAAQSVPEHLQRAIQQGEVYESATLMALQLHFLTASYRMQPRSHVMATALGGVTQQSQATVLASKLVMSAQLEDTQSERAAAFNAADSSSTQSITLPVHTLPAAVPLSLLGHWHAYPPAKVDTQCDRNSALTESVHAFGNTETLSHMQLRERMAAQSQALYRDVAGSSRLNMPPSFPLAFSDLMTEASAATLYRCQSVGAELRRLGVWLCSLNRGAVLGSSYAQRDTDLPLDTAPSFLLSAHRRAHLPGDVSTERAEKFDVQFTQEQIDEISECGTSLQNLAELY